MLLIRHGQSQFNVVFSATRQDPGIPDPELTDEGHRQVRATAAALSQARAGGAADIRRIVTSPYTRTLQTATIIAGMLDVPVTVDPLVRERAAFSCDVGGTPAELQRRFPEYRFDHLDHPWWHDHVGLGAVETEAALDARAVAFSAAMAQQPDWRHVAVVTHWGFIRSLTGQRLLNGETIPYTPAG